MDTPVTRQAVVEHFQSTLHSFATLDLATQNGLVETRLKQLQAREADAARQLDEAQRRQEADAAALAVDEADTGDPRERLRFAIASHDYAVDVLALAQANVQRAQQRVDDADAQLQGFSDLDERIDEALVRQIKAGEDSSLPADLLDVQTARGKLVDRITSERRALVRLRQELTDAEVATGHTLRNRSLAAQAMVMQYGERLAVELQAADAKAATLRTIITTLANTWFPDAQAGPPPLPQIIKDVVAQPTSTSSPYGDPTIKARFAQLHAALLADPDLDPADFGILP